MKRFMSVAIGEIVEAEEDERSAGESSKSLLPRSKVLGFSKMTLTWGLFYSPAGSSDS
jgi:hypothetical protein